MIDIGESMESIPILPKRGQSHCSGTSTSTENGTRLLSSYDAAGGAISGDTNEDHCHGHVSSGASILSDSDGSSESESGQSLVLVPPISPNLNLEQGNSTSMSSDVDSYPTTPIRSNRPTCVDRHHRARAREISTKPGYKMKLPKFFRSALSVALFSAAICIIRGLFFPSPSSSSSSTPQTYTPSELFDLVFSQAKDQGQGQPSNSNSILTNTKSILNPLSASEMNIKMPLLKSSNHKNSKLVIAGKMTVLDTFCNVAELDLKEQEWALQERIQLSLYNSYSGGEVYSLLVNHTFDRFEGPTSSTGGDVDKQGQFGGELLVVGAFDTTDRNSQTTYCSVGEYDGTKFSKVGEGLCNSALSKGMKITAAALAGPHDVYVAGSFTTQVWDGVSHEFISIYNIAHYNSLKKIWSPLPFGQIACSWCKPIVLALAYDSKRRQLHVTGKFNAVNGGNIPSGLAIYDEITRKLVAHPGGGLTMWNSTENGVGTALQLDEEAGILYVMGSFDRVGDGELCRGLGAYEIATRRWSCLDDPQHSVMPSGGGNMLLTPYGLMVAGRIQTSSTWHDSDRPYTIALLKTTSQPTDKKDEVDSKSKSDTKSSSKTTTKSESMFDAPNRTFAWCWLPGFDGHEQPIHALANGFGAHEGTVFIAGNDLVAAYRYEDRIETVKKTVSSSGSSSSSAGTITVTRTISVPITIDLSGGHVRGAVMAISQLDPHKSDDDKDSIAVGYTIGVYLIAFGALLGMFLALLCNKSINQTLMAFLFPKDSQMNGISLDTLTYGTMKNSSMNEAYYRAMKNRCVQHPHLLQIIDPQEIILHRIIGEGTFGRVWSARLNSASVAVKEFIFAQAAVAGRSSQQNEIIEEIIGEAGMMAILRHPNVLQLFGCSLTAQAIWIVSELCSLGSLRHLLDDKERELPIEVRLKIALQVAEGMAYLHNQDPTIIHRDLKSHNILVHETFTEKTEMAWTIKSSEVQKRNVDSINNGMKDSLPYRFEKSEKSQKMDSEATIIAKIGDWGSARAALSGSRTMTHGVGTACWLAPEVIKFARSSQRSDVYSYGIILWELATREEVYGHLEGTQVIAQVANDNLRPPVPEDNPLASLMVKCWCVRPEDRLTFKQIVKELNIMLSEIEEQKTSVTSSQRSAFSQSTDSYQNHHTEPVDEE